MPESRRSFVGVSLSIVLTVAMAGGCSGRDANLPKLATTTGVVTFNGTPLAGATISFVATDPAKGHLPGVGSTDDDGEYRIRSYDLDGAVVGSHKVIIVAIDEDSLVKDPKGVPLPRMHPKWKAPKWRIPERFGQPEISKLTAEVLEDTDNRIDFSLVE